MTPNLTKLKVVRGVPAPRQRRTTRYAATTAGVLLALVASSSSGRAESPSPPSPSPPPPSPSPSPAAAPPAAAAPVSDVDLQVAKSEFEAAQTLFIKDQYDEAAEHFLAAFARKPF